VRESVKFSVVRDDPSGGGLDVTLRGFAIGQKLFSRYTLIKTLGRGGMGIVWLARDDELERDVALKFLSELIVHDRAVLSELKHETKRSLELTHKNIVRIYDFVQDAQSACISMEYIDGDTLSNLRIDRASKVFETHELADWTCELCDALDYAHNHARIVHRDLKPSNLMLNSRGELKVADFGIARRLGDSVSMLTNEHGMSGTLVYMSPQQLNGDRGTHLDDVYSFGATIYELLTSKPPFYSGNIDRQIRETVPPSMSQRREELQIEGEPIADSWEEVVARCLQKEAARRPQSVTEIVDRLRLRSRRTHRPTRTRWKATVPESVARLRRRVKRWVVGVAPLLIIIVGLVIWQMRSQGELKAEVAKLRQGVMEYPQMEAQVRGSQSEKDQVGVQEQIYAQLGKQFRVDPKILREKLPKFAEELRHAPNVSAYERANASYVAQDYGEAERLALQAADETRKLEPANSKDILQALELAGLSAQKRIQYARAMQYFREAEKLTDRNRNLEEWVTLQHEIADLLVVEGKYGDAEKVFRSVIAERAPILGLEHPDTLDSRHRLIYALTRQTKYTEAEAEARDVLRLREKVLGPENVDTVVSRYNLADALAEQGKNAEAESLYREIIRANEKALGSEHPRTLAARVGLATALGSQGKNAEAESLYREIIRANEKVFGPEHPNTLNARQDLATTLHADQKYSEAEAQYRDVIKIDEKLVGPEHPDTLICRNNLAEMLDDAGKYAEAETECLQIIAVEEKVLGPENLATLNSRGNLAVALIGQGKFAEAQVQYSDLLKVMERVLGLEHPDTLGFTSKIANALSRQNKTGEAMEIAKGAEERARKVLGPDNPSTQKYAKLVQDIEGSPKK
jgi:tetratricopeptide (TPR) repeat protein